MTTIAANREMMAGDSLADSSGIKTRCDKIHRAGDAIIGFAGSLEDGLRFVEWYSNRRKKKPEFKGTGEDGSHFLVLEDGELWFFESCEVAIPIYEDFTAIGSGSHLALAAMEMGADPREAVKIACKYDMGSGLPVVCEKL